MKPSVLHDFATNNGIELPSGSNTKRSEESLTLYDKKFSPQHGSKEDKAQSIEEKGVIRGEKEVSADSDRIGNQKNLDPDVNKVAEHQPSPPEMDIEHDSGEKSFAETQAEDERVTVIRMPKIDLPGLTVKGKIELPEPKKKEPKQEPSVEERKPHQKDHRLRHRKNGRKQKNGYNPIEAARKREEKKEKRLAQEKAKKQKEQRKKRYEEHFQHPPKPTKASLKIDRHNQAKTEEEKKIEPKNVFSKAWDWLVDPDRSTRR